jgi:polyisoprenoid-binding protein YceI
MSKWVIDPDHSVATFAVRHMMISDIHGQFNSIKGTIQFDPPDLASVSVEAEIDAAGLYTGIQKRDDHLRSPDFFDTVKYPKIIFKGLASGAISNRHCKVTGDLTIRGITRTVTLDVEYSGPVKDPFDEGGMSIGVTASAVIDRGDYDMTLNYDMEGGVVIGKEVRITLNLEADLV